VQWSEYPPTIDQPEDIGLYPVRKKTETKPQTTRVNDWTGGTTLTDLLRGEIYSQLSLEQAFNWHGHDFKQYGSKLKGNCPWHDSQSGTAFYAEIKDGSPVWRCPACDIGGSVIEYRHRLSGANGSPRGSEFVALVKELASEVGVTVPDSKPDFSNGNRQNSGGSSGNGNDSKAAQPPSIQELASSEVNKLIAEVIKKGVAGAELRTALNEISHFTPWRIDQLYKLHQQQLEEIERIELRDNTREQLESLLSASNASLDLHQFLHPTLAKPLLHIASRLNLKPEVYLTTLLTVVSSLHHPNTRIWLNKEDDFDQPPNLYGGIVADSSQKKSPILKAIAKKPLKVLQAEEKHSFEQKLNAYHDEMEDWEKLPPEQKREADPPVKPERSLFFFTKTTGEGLEYQAARQPEQGMLYLSDELVSIINNQNKYTNGKGSDKQDILSYYDGTANTTLRADGIKSELDTILLAIIGAIQPQVLQNLLNNCEDSDGNWARFLFVYQPRVAARLHADGGQVDLTGLLVDLYRKIRALPITEYTLSPEAFKVFQQAYNRYEQHRVNDPLAGMRSVWGKSEGRAGRLALNLHVINSLANGETPSGVIDVETMRRAIALTDYYATQVKAMYTEFSDPDALAPHLAKVIEMSLKDIHSQSQGWLKAGEVCRSITKAKRPTGETVRLWFSELVTLGKGEVKGAGRSLLFRAFSPEKPPSDKIDKIDSEIDNLSHTETTLYQVFQEKVDKIDKIDDFHQNLIETEKAPEVVRVTELEKMSLLGESSILSTIAQNDQSVRDTKIDDLSTEVSIFDKPSILEAIIPTSPTEIPTQLEEVEVQEQAPQQSEQPICQRLDGNCEIQEREIDRVDTKIDNLSTPTVVTQEAQSNAASNDEWHIGDQIVVDATDLPPSLAKFDGARGTVEVVKDNCSQCLINFADESMHIPFRGLRKVTE
jgi:hypothetical protein